MPGLVRLSRVPGLLRIKSTKTATAISGMSSTLKSSRTGKGGVVRPPAPAFGVVESTRTPPR
jgi:hypothetical protein